MPNIFWKLSSCCRKQKMENDEKTQNDPATLNPDPNQVTIDIPPVNQDLTSVDTQNQENKPLQPKKYPQNESKNSQQLFSVTYSMYLIEKLRPFAPIFPSLKNKIIFKLKKLWEMRKKQSQVQTTEIKGMMTYSCPVCHNIDTGIKSWQHFEKCMIEQLNMDPCGYAVYCALSLNPKTQAENSKLIISKYLKNIINFPNEDKFKSIRTRCPLFYESVYPIVGGMQILELAGFKNVIKAREGLPEVFLEFPKSTPPIAAQIMINLLDIAQIMRPIPIRNLKFVKFNDEEKTKWIDEGSNIQELANIIDETSPPLTWIDFTQTDHRKTTILIEIKMPNCLECEFLYTETSNFLYEFIESFFHMKTNTLNLKTIDNLCVARDDIQLVELKLVPKSVLFLSIEGTDIDPDKLISSSSLYVE